MLQREGLAGELSTLSFKVRAHSGFLPGEVLGFQEPMAGPLLPPQLGRTWAHHLARSVGGSLCLLPRAPLVILPAPASAHPPPLPRGGGGGQCTLLGRASGKRGSGQRPHPAEPRSHSPAGVILQLPGLPSQGLPGQAGAKAPSLGGPFVRVHLALGGRREHQPQEAGESHGAQPQPGQPPQHLQLEKDVTTGSPDNVAVPCLVGLLDPSVKTDYPHAREGQACGRVGLARARMASGGLGPTLRPCGNWLAPSETEQGAPVSCAWFGHRSYGSAGHPPSGPQSYRAGPLVPCASEPHGTGPRRGCRCSLQRPQHLHGATWHHPQLQSRLAQGLGSCPLGMPPREDPNTLCCIPP